MEITVIEPTRKRRDRLRVCAYARVSTDHLDQEDSLENQITHYRQEIESNPRYEFIEVYHDFGISGFKENRPGFQKMIEDARNGTIDLIITKSLTRFSRNTVTTLNTIRELRDLGVGIIFELQHIDTREESGELMISILSAFAQGESESASLGAKMVYRRKYEAGIPVHYLERSFGYTKNQNGDYIPDPDQAKWVVEIFKQVAAGNDMSAVARYLNGHGVKTDRGASFTCSTVKRIVENELYKGDYIMHKHFVNADRKLVPNRGEEDAWYIEDDHEPIVSRKLWDKAQEARKLRREYLDTRSVTGDLNEENYPYMNKLFCAECGFPLYRRIYSHGNRVCWQCSGKKRYGGDFCGGINVPDSVIRSWGALQDEVFLRKEHHENGQDLFKYVRKSTWKKDHKVKKRPSGAPALNEKNYPYRRSIFCAKCGSHLTRHVQGKDKVMWICSGSKHKGVSFCPGVRVPDEVIRGWGDINTHIYIERTGDDNGKCYTYSSEPVSGKD